MVTTPAMVLSFPEKSTSCREHEGAQGECTPLGWHPRYVPKTSLLSLGHATEVCRERVRAVPHGHQSLPLAVVYSSFICSWREKHSCSRTPRAGGVPRGKGTFQAPRRPAQASTHLHVVGLGKEHHRQTHLHHQPGEDHCHHGVPTRRRLLGQRQRPACRQSREVGLGHLAGTNRLGHQPGVLSPP